MGNKLIISVFSFALIFFSLGNIGSAQSGVVSYGNTKYFLDNQDNVYKAEIYSNDHLVKIQEFYPNTKLDNASRNIKYIFNLDNNGYISNADKLDQETQKVINTYEYYPNTVYGAHGTKIKYKFYIDKSGYLTKAYKGANGASKILAWYEYYPKTIYGHHAEKIKYKFYLDDSGYLDKAYKSANGTLQILAWYEYYPNTIYGHHGDKIKYKFYLDGSGYLDKAYMSANGTRQISAWYEYYPNTRYGSQGDKIKYKFYINDSGYLSSAIRRENGTARTLTWYGYLPNTIYGKHGSRINKRILNVPIISQFPELPTGCEITAVTMMLQYKGLDVNKVSLAKEMPKSSSNPRVGFVGNPFTKRGWSIYPVALKELVAKYEGSVRILTGDSIRDLKRQLSSNKPVVVWVSPMHGFSVHALVLTGFDKNNFYFNDCWTKEKNVKISKKKFMKIWSNQDRRAISY